MSFLDTLLQGVKSIANGSTALPQRPQLVFTGAGVVVSDSSSTNQTVVSIDAAGGASQYNTTLANGLNSNVAVPNPSSIRFGGYTGAVILGGIAPTTPPTPGQIYQLNFTVSGQPVTIRNNDAASTSTNRILTGTGSDVLLPPGQTPKCYLQYDGTLNCYTLQSSGVHQVNEVNVKDFGATGNYVTDDTAAIVSAIASLVSMTDPYSGQALGGGVIYFPAGTYLKSADIVLPIGIPIIIRGAGRDCTQVLDTRVAGNGFVCPPNSLNGPYGGSYQFEDIVVSTTQNQFSNEWPTNIRMPHSTYTSGQTLAPPGPSNRLLQCTSSGTTGEFVPFGQLWGGVPSDPISNAPGYSVEPFVKVTGTPAAWYKSVLIYIDVAGPIGTMVFQWTTNDWVTTNTVSTTGVTTAYALGSSGLTANFVLSQDYPLGVTYSSPSFWQGFSTIVGDVITDGTCEWTVIDGGTGILVNGASVQIERVNCYGFVNGFVFDAAEIVNVSKCKMDNVNCIWIVNGNERRNAGTDPVLEVVVANVLAFDHLDLGPAVMGIADSGGGLHTFRDINFEGPTSSGYYAWFTDVTELDCSAWLTEGAANGVYLGSRGPFTGALFSASDLLEFRRCYIDPEGTSPVNVTMSGGTAPPGATYVLSAICLATNQNELAFVTEITTGGTLASTNVRFRWSSDGGVTWSSNVTANSTVVLGSTGASINFPTGTYSTDNVYLAVGMQKSCFDTTGEFFDEGASNIEIKGCKLGNNGTYGFTNSQYIAGLHLKNNTYNLPNSFLSTPAIQSAIGGAITVDQSRFNAGRGFGCYPQVVGDDMFGQVAWRSAVMTLVTGANNNVANPGVASVEIAGPSGAFSITGIQTGTEGQILRLCNLTGQQMTIAHQSGSSTAGNKIICPDATDYVVGGGAPPSGGFNSVTLRYSASKTAWLVDGAVW